MTSKRQILIAGMGTSPAVCLKGYIEKSVPAPRT